MSLRLSDLRDCFEGVIPSIIATTSADGVPNVSYLSHVEQVDDGHIALSNQFFGKTARNLRDNPQACVMLVDAASGRQVRLAVTWLRDESEGPLFDAMTASLSASSAQVGMADVMRLASVALFRVDDITALPHPEGLDPAPAPPPRPSLALAAEAVARIAAQTETAGIVDDLLDGACRLLDAPAAILFQHDPGRAMLVTLASRGYFRSGAGSEIARGSGIAGTAAALGRAVRVSDMSRLRRFGAAIRDSSPEEETRSIALPGLPDAQSQIAVPMYAKGMLYGVLFAESPRRLAFRPDDAVALSLVANHAAATLLIGEALAGEAVAPPAPAGPDLPEGCFRVLHHRFDDSVFVDNGYVIRGVAGRLLVYLLERHLAEGRVEFSNREIRLAPDLRLPDFKDNLETRLLLLRQRLDEKGCPVRLMRAGRGLIRLHLSRRPQIERAP